MRGGGAAAARRSAVEILLRQFLGATLLRHAHISLPVVGEDGQLVHQPYQLLDLERRNLVVRHYLEEEERLQLHGLYTVSVQPLITWAATLGMGEGHLNTCDVFPLHGTGKTHWRTRRRGVHGCVIGVVARVHAQSSLYHTHTSPPLGVGATGVNPTARRAHEIELAGVRAVGFCVDLVWSCVWAWCRCGCGRVVGLVWAGCGSGVDVEWARG